MGSKRKRAATCAALLAVAALPAPALAQTASQITPPSFAPAERAPVRAPLAIPTDTLEAPEGAERIFIAPARVEVIGGRLAPDAAAALRARLTGKRVSLAEIFAAARRAEAAEARAGRVLVRVLVPRQEMADGAVLRIVVVEGFVERVQLSGVPAPVRARVAALLAGIEGRADLDLAEIERRLTLAADVPGLTLRSTLSAGVRQGGTVLRIDGAWHPVTGFVAVDNSLSSALGRTAFAAGVDFNSVLGAGELLYLRASGLPNIGNGTSMLDATPRDRALAVGTILPFAGDGLTLRAEFTDARTAPRHVATLPGFASRYRRLAISLRYPLVRRRALSVGLEGRFDAENERVRIIEPLSLPISSDRLRSLRIATDFAAWLSGGGVATARAEASFGIDGLGARSAADASAILPLSRAGGDADYRKLEVSARIEQPFAAHLSLNLSARAQTSFGESLLNSQQFGIAGPDAISPLPSGALQGDAGHVVRVEARAPYSVDRAGWSARLSPYVFAAQGAARLEQPTAVERRVTQALAYGVGLRIAGQSRGAPDLSVTVEYGRAHVAGYRPDRLSISLLTRF